MVVSYLFLVADAVERVLDRVFPADAINPDDCRQYVYLSNTGSSSVPGG